MKQTKFHKFTQSMLSMRLLELLLKEHESIGVLIYGKQITQTRVNIILILRLDHLCDGNEFTFGFGLLHFINFDRVQE